MSQLKRMSPLIIFVVLFLLFSNWWRIQLWLNPVDLTQQSDIQLYVTSWCPYCAKAKSYLQAMNVEYEELNIETSSAAKMRYEKYPGMGVPLIVIGDHVIRGFDRERIRKALIEQSRSSLNAT